MNDVIFEHDASNDLSFSLSYDSDTILSLRDAANARHSPFVSGRQHTIAAVHSIDRNEIVPQYLTYLVGNAAFGIDRDSARGKYRLHAELPEEIFRFIRSPGRAWELPAPMKTYQFPDQARTYYQNASFLADLELRFEDQLDKVYYLGPLREYPRRDYLWARSRPTDVGKKGEKAVDAILAATSLGETRNLKPKAHHKKFEEMIAYWLKRMGLIHAFRVHEIAEGSNRYQVKVQSVKDGPEVLLTDVGFGVSQILPVITLLYYVPEGSTVILEQPEIHLHPLAQAELADVLINVAGHRRVQILLESHSEHLLLRLQRRIAEEEISHDLVKLYFCDKDKMSSNITPLEIDVFGNIMNWPKNFMGNSFEETAEAEIARIERRSKGAA